MFEEEIFDNDLIGNSCQKLHENVPLEMSKNSKIVSRNGLTFEDLETFLLRKLAARADFFFHFANSCRLQNGIR